MGESERKQGFDRRENVARDEVRPLHDRVAEGGRARAPGAAAHVADLAPADRHHLRHGNFPGLSGARCSLALLGTPGTCRILKIGYLSEIRRNFGTASIPVRQNSFIFLILTFLIHILKYIEIP